MIALRFVFSLILELSRNCLPHSHGTSSNRADLGACGWISIVLGPGLIWAVTFTRSGAPMQPPAKLPFTRTAAAVSGRSSISKYTRWVLRSTSAGSSASPRTDPTGWG